MKFLLSKRIAKETAEDLVQQAFIYIWSHRSSIDPSKSLRAYLFRIAYTRMLNHIRDHKKFVEFEAAEADGSGQNPEQTAQEKDLLNAIDNALESMPEKRSTVFQLCFMRQLTYKEAAQVMDVSPKTIENHMGLALKDLRKKLKDFKEE